MRKYDPAQQAEQLADYTLTRGDADYGGNVLPPTLRCTSGLTKLYRMCTFPSALHTSSLSSLTTSEGWLNLEALASLQSQDHFRPALQTQSKSKKNTNPLTQATLNSLFPNFSTDASPPASSSSSSFSSSSSSSSSSFVSDSSPPSAASSFVLHAGTLLARRYCVVSQLAKGTFAQMVVAEDTYAHEKSRHRRVAIKVMNAQYAAVGTQESVRLRQLNVFDKRDNMHIVRMLNCFFFGPHFCLVLELLPANMLSFAQELENRGGSLPIEYIRKVAIQLMLALDFLSTHHIIHADIKLENLLIQSSKSLRFKLGDFGNSFQMKHCSYYYDDFELQSLPYRAPEVLYGLPFDTQIDMWSAGCLLVELYLGKPLFSCNNKDELLFHLYKRIGAVPEEVYKNGKYYSQHVSSISALERQYIHHKTEKSDLSPLYAVLARTLEPTFTSFVLGILTLDPSKRLTPRSALCHPFLTPLFPAGLLLGQTLSFASLYEQVFAIRHLGKDKNASPLTQAGASSSVSRTSSSSSPSESAIVPLPPHPSSSKLHHLSEKNLARYQKIYQCFNELREMCEELAHEPPNNTYSQPSHTLSSSSSASFSSSPSPSNSLYPAAVSINSSVSTPLYKRPYFETEARDRAC